MDYGQKEFEKRKRTGKIGCVIMASGLSRRFGRNKLLEDFCGKTLIQTILDKTVGVFDKRVVVTRTKEVEEICHNQNIDVIFHELPNRNDAVRLAVDYLTKEELDGIIFCPVDQPFLKRETLIRMRNVFCSTECEIALNKDAENTHGIQERISEVIAQRIFRLAAGDRVGTPILFGKMYFEELRNLPEKKGGAFVAKRHPENVGYIEAEECELMDVDTPEELKIMLKYDQLKRK